MGQDKVGSDTNLSRFITGLFGRAWFIAGGLGGLGGAALWAFLVLVGNKSPDYAFWVALAVVFAFLFAASYKQWSVQRQQIAKLGRKKQELERELEKKVDLTLYEERKLINSLDQLVKDCRSIDKFIQGLVLDQV